MDGCGGQEVQVFLEGLQERVCRCGGVGSGKMGGECHRSKEVERENNVDKGLNRDEYPECNIRIAPEEGRAIV